VKLPDKGGKLKAAKHEIARIENEKKVINI
jgi:hypothetical protein